LADHGQASMYHVMSQSKARSYSQVMAKGTYTVSGHGQRSMHTSPGHVQMDIHIVGSNPKGRMHSRIMAKGVYTLSGHGKGNVHIVRSWPKKTHTSSYFCFYNRALKSKCRYLLTSFFKPK